MQLIRIRKDSSIQIASKIESFLNPSYVYLPLKNNKLIVKQNEKILKEDYVFLNNYEVKSPISGIVLGLSTFQDGKYLVIKNDYKEKRKIIKRKIEPNFNISYLLESLEKHHLKNLLKKFKNKKNFANIIISAVEDEPYNQNKILLFQENIQEILFLVDKLSLIYRSKVNTIVIKENEKQLIEDCINTIGTYPNIKLSLINNYYLLGQDKYLLNYLKYNEKETLILNVEELVQIYQALINNKVSTSRLVTISGDGIVGPGKVMRVKKYTLAAEVINKYFQVEDDVCYFESGLLQGKEKSLENIVITDEVKVINIMKKVKVKTVPCFNCGKCVDICPVGINVVKCLKQKTISKKCLNCGLCNYICPAYIDLKKKVLGDQDGA